MARAKKPKETVIQDEGPKKFTISYRDYQNQVWTKLINKLWVIEWQRESINSVWPLYRCLESIYIHFEKWTELRTKLGEKYGELMDDGNWKIPDENQDKLNDELEKVNDVLVELDIERVLGNVLLKLKEFPNLSMEELRESHRIINWDN